MTDVRSSGDRVRHPSRVRYRIRFGKDGPLRYISHLELMVVWERTLRRAGAPVVYSQGFNRRPQIQLAAPLPLGYASTCELIDVWLEGTIPAPDDLLLRLRTAAPEGLEVQTVWEVEGKGPALQTLTRAAAYRAIPTEAIGADTLRERVDALLAQETIRRERRGKPYDLRPLILSLAALPGDDPVLEMALALSQEHGTGRPDEVIEALGLDPTSTRVTRTEIMFVGGTSPREAPSPGMLSTPDREGEDA